MIDWRPVLDAFRTEESRWCMIGRDRPEMRSRDPARLIVRDGQTMATEYTGEKGQAALDDMSLKASIEAAFRVLEHQRKRGVS